MTKNNLKVGVLNLMGNVFMKKCENVFLSAQNFLKKYNLKKDFDFLIVDFHGEITSEKNAMGHFFDGKATLVIGTHTHVPTADYQILEKGTAYITDVGMSGDYNSIIGMNKQDALNRFMFPNNKKSKLEVSLGEPTMCGVIIDTLSNGLSKSIKPLRLGGRLEQTIL